MVGIVLFTRVALPPLWIADQVRNDGVGVHRFHPLLPVSGTGTGFDPLPSRERGYGCFSFRQVMFVCSLSVWCMSDQSNG